MHTTIDNHPIPDSRQRRQGTIDVAFPPITVEARRYALKELARRAGVSMEFFITWKIEIGSTNTKVSFGEYSPAIIEFAHQAENSLDKLPLEIPVARAGWPNLQRPSPRNDLIIPFCITEEDWRLPLYKFASSQHVVCRLDLLRSFLFSLSRLEETLCKSFDQHGRFPALASLAYQHGFLERPILDEHGLAFQDVLSRLLPTWQPAHRTARVKLTHDIDHIGIPFDVRSTFGHALKRRNASAMLRDLAARFSSIEPAELAGVRQLAQLSASRNLHSAFYWKASSRGPFDSGYDPALPRVQRVLAELRNLGFELGVHPGYETFDDRSKLVGEVEYLRQCLGVTSPGGRQHYLRWSPDTWLDWEAAGLSYDSSLGFADAFGFRCGTAFPFQPWSLHRNRELNLIELPLILMDCTPTKYMKLSREAALPRIKALVERIERTGGVFTLLWHNSTLLDPTYDGWYEPVLDLLDGFDRCKLPANPGDLW